MISVPSPSAYTAETIAVLATGLPMGAPWIRSFKEQKISNVLIVMEGMGGKNEYFSKGK